MDPALRLCSECSLIRAKLLCACTLPETPVCEECFPEHSRKKSVKGHPICLISDLPADKDYSYAYSKEAFPPLPTSLESPLESNLQQIPSIPSSPPKTFFGSAEETPELAEKHYLESIQIFSVHFPLSLRFGDCLNNLGSLYANLKRFEQAEEQLLRSYSLLEANFPVSEEFAECQAILGMLYMDMQQWEKSKDYYLRAISIYSTNYPQSWDFALYLSYLGDLYRYIGQLDEAKAHYLRSICIYIEYHPQHDTSLLILKDLAEFCKEWQLYEDLEVTYLRMISANSEESDLPNSLLELRELYEA